MFCPKCGGVLKDGAKFCGKCGATVLPSPEVSGAPEPAHQAPAGAAPVVAAAPTGDIFSALSDTTQAPAAVQPPVPPVAPPMEPPVLEELPPIPPKKRSRKVAILAIVLVAVLVIAAGAVAAPAIKRAMNPKAFAVKCLTSTLDQVLEGEDRLGLDAVSKSMAAGKSQEKLSLKLVEIPQSMVSDLPLPADQLLGTSLNLTLESDMAQRKIALEAGASLGSFPLGTARLFVDNNIASLNSPELTGQTYYGVNTETLGKDLTDAGLYGMEEPLSFNLFDFNGAKDADGKATTPAPALEEETAKDLKALYDTFYKEIVVEAGDKETVEVNGEDVNCKLYTMTVPAPAFRDYCYDVLKRLTKDAQFSAAYEDMLLPALTQLYGSYLTDYMDIKTMLSEFKDALQYLQDDVVIDLYISGKTVVRAECSAAIADENDYEVDLELTLQFGDKVGLTNAFSAELDMGDDSFRVNIALASQGDSDGKDSVFARETTASLTADKEELFSLDMSTSYDAKATDDNFSFDCAIMVEGDELAANAQGTVLIDGGKGTLSCDFSRLSVESMDETLALSGALSVAPLTEFSFTPATPVMVLKDFPDSIDTDSMEANLAVIQEKLYEAFPDLKPFEADKYMEGYLQALLLGKADAAFLQQSGLTQSDVTSMHEDALRQSATMFSSDFGLDYDVRNDDALMQPLVEFYQRLYQYMYDNSLITVTGYREDSDGSYAVTVVPAKLHLWDTITNTNGEAYAALQTRMDGLAMQDTTPFMDSDAFDAWAMDVYWPAYIEGLVELCDMALASQVPDQGAQNAMTISVYDYESDQGIYTVDNYDLEDFKSTIGHLY